MFWERFIALCEANNVKATNVAKELGISTSNITYYKRGSVPNGTMLQRMADYFGVSTDYLLGKDVKADNQVAVKMSVEDLKLFNTIKLLDEQSLAQLSDYINYLLSKR